MDAEGRVQERASPPNYASWAVLLRLGLKNLSTRVVRTFHARILLVNDHLLAGILGGKNVGTPIEELWELLQGEIAARQALEQQVQQSTPTRKRGT